MEWYSATFSISSFTKYRCFGLNIFSSLSSVSIYNVYSLVVLGVRNIVVSLTAGIQSKFGALIVKEDFQLLN